MNVVYTILVLLVVFAGAAYAVHRYFKAKKAKKETPGGLVSGQGNVPPPAPAYHKFLRVLKTVVNGGDKVKLESFLLQYKDTIEAYSYYNDFNVKFDAIIEDFEQKV